MLRFEIVPNASEPCCAINCAMGISEKFQILAKTKHIERETFEPRRFARKIYVLIPLLRPFINKLAESLQKRKKLPYYVCFFFHI